MTHDPGSIVDAGERVPRGGDFLDRAGLAGLDAPELVRRTSALAPMVAEHAAEAERIRRPVDAVWSALRASGYFYLFTPKGYGGLAADFDAFIDASLPIAEACASTGLVACFSAGHNWSLSLFPQQTQEETWGGAFPYIVAPRLGNPPGRATRVDGGYLVSGRWRWGTGIMHADWLTAAALLADGDAPPKPLLTLMPAGMARVFDTWDFDGMAGTGSNDVEIDQAFVPEAYAVDMLAAFAGRDAAARTCPEPIYGVPAIPFEGMMAAVPALGAARAALRLTRDRLAGHVKPTTTEPQANKPAAQIRLAEADLMVRAAELLLRDAGRRSIAMGALSGEAQGGPRIAARAQITKAVSLCRDAALHLGEGAGTSVHQSGNPFSRAVRDVSMMASHVAYDVDLAYELHGRALVGLPPNSMLF